MTIPKTNFLSIIVCAYNEEATIGTKIYDILTNDKNNDVEEIIIVDDNSSDGTSKIVQDCARNEKRIVVVKNTDKPGKWGALVTGLKYARQEIICITDADVAFQENTLEEALQLFNAADIGAVTSNQKIIPIKAGKEFSPIITPYEKFRNFFRVLESKIDSTPACHGQCMFFRKKCLRLTGNNSMADDLDIAIRIRREGYRTIFSQTSYYLEKMPDLLNVVSRHIFRRRAKAVAQTLLNHKDILFNPKFKTYGTICFPIEFFINIVFPFFFTGGLVIIIFSLLFFGKSKILFLIFASILFIFRRFLLMAWYQISGVISAIFIVKNNCLRWTNTRY